jgi:predicted aspartyl protease
MAILTIHNSDLLTNGPTIEVGIKSVHYPKTQNFTNLLSMLDTGAGITAVNQAIIDKLNWEPFGETKIHTPSSSNTNVFIYEANIVFSSDVYIKDIKVIGAIFDEQDIDMLIGRDILENSILIYNGCDNSFSLSF